MPVSLANPLIREDLQGIFGHLGGLDALRGGHLLLSGGTGFFGKWLLALCDLLNEQGWGLRVTVLSRDPQRFLSAEPRYRDCDWLNWITADMRQLQAQDLRADFLLHAATDASLTGQVDRLKLLDDLYEGSRRVLDLAVRSGVRRVLTIGSGAQYGVPAGDRLREDDARACSSTDPSQVYGEAKRLQEMLAALYAERHGLEVVFSRCFAFLGAGLPLDTHFAVGNFIRDALYRERIILNSSGEALRSYLYGADLAGWLLCLLAGGQNGKVYNVGSDAALSIADLARRVGALLAPDKPVQIGTATGNNLRSAYVPDISPARELGLSVWTPLDEAILRTAAWARRTGEVFV